MLFVGSNPSNASETDSPFHGSTRSGRILSSWCEDLPGTRLHVNVSDLKTENNRPLKVAEIKASLDSLKSKIEEINPSCIVALGKTAAKALSMLDVQFHEMPHPSGMNR